MKTTLMNTPEMDKARRAVKALLELSASMQALAHHTQDHAEAVAALLEKRPGTYTGS